LIFIFIFTSFFFCFCFIFNHFCFHPKKGFINYDESIELACESGNLELVSLLISKGIENYGESLEYACRSGNKKLVEMIIPKVAINDESKNFEYACSSGNKEIVELFDSEHFLDYNCFIPFACESGNKEIIEFLISKGANDWNCFLLSSVHLNDLSLIDFFISKGANDWEGSLHKACQKGIFRLVQFFYEKGKFFQFLFIFYFNLFVGLKIKSESLECSISYSNIYICKYLLSKGVNTNFQDEDYSHPLETTYYQGNYSLFIKLLYFGSTFDVLENYFVEVSNKSNKIFLSIISDYKNDKLWNTNRSKFFPQSFVDCLLSFFICIKIQSKISSLKIPKPILMLICEQYTTQQIKINITKQK
jgi:hypothetical protein